MSFGYCYDKLTLFGLSWLWQVDINQSDITRSCFGQLVMTKTTSGNVTLIIGCILVGNRSQDLETGIQGSRWNNVNPMPWDPSWSLSCKKKSLWYSWEINNFNDDPHNKMKAFTLGVPPYLGKFSSRGVGSIYVASPSTRVHYISTACSPCITISHVSWPNHVALQVFIKPF